MNGRAGFPARSGFRLLWNAKPLKGAGLLREAGSLRKVLSAVLLSGFLAGVLLASGPVGPVGFAACLAPGCGVLPAYGAEQGGAAADAGGPPAAGLGSDAPAAGSGGDAAGAGAGGDAADAVGSRYGASPSGRGGAGTGDPETARPGAGDSGPRPAISPGSRVGYSYRLLVGFSGELRVRDGDAVLGTFGRAALLGFDTAGELRSALAHYRRHAEFAAIDGQVEAASGKARAATLDSAESSARAGRVSAGDDPLSEADVLAAGPSRGAAGTGSGAGAGTGTGSGACAAPPAAVPPAAAPPAGADAASGGRLVALVDTGVPASPNAVSRVSVLGDDPDDDNGHGTAMLAAMVRENPDVGVISIKALDKAGRGTVASVYAAIRLAQKEGAGVINLSFSAEGASPAIEAAIREAVDAGCIVVAAAGNGGGDASRCCPANVAAALTVGACDARGARLPESNGGDAVDAWVEAGTTSHAAARASGWLSAHGENADALFGSIARRVPAGSGEDAGDGGSDQAGDAWEESFGGEGPGPGEGAPGSGESTPGPGPGSNSSPDPSPAGNLARAPACAIEFAANGGSGYMPSYTTPGDGGGFELPECLFLHLGGRRFLGWNTAPDGSGLAVPARQYIVGNGFERAEGGRIERCDLSEPLSSGKLVLYAQWSTPALDDLEFLVEDRAYWTNLANGTYLVQFNANTSFVMDRASGKAATGTNVRLYTSNGSRNGQQWVSTKLSGYDNANVYKFAAAQDPGQVLSLNSDTPANGNNVYMQTWSGAKRNIWYLDKNANGSCALQPYRNGAFSVDLESGTQANGTNIQVWRNSQPSDASVNQSWRLTRASYTVAFNGNGATGGSTASQGVNIDQATALRGNGFSRTGHSFAGWATSAGGGAVYGDGQSVTNLSVTHGTTVNLYATWHANSYRQTVQVRYQNADGSWGGYSPVIDEDRVYGTTVSWSRAADAVYRAASLSYTVPDSAQTRYVDVYRQTYSVSINIRDPSGTDRRQDGGAGTFSAWYGDGSWVSSQRDQSPRSLRAGQEVRVKDIVPATGMHLSSVTGHSGIRDGYYYRTVAGGDVIDIDMAWNVWHVEYDGNGASSGSMPGSSYRYGLAGALEPNAYARPGYEFAGWNTMIDGSGTAYQDGQAVLNLTAQHEGRVVLHAQWRPLVELPAAGGPGPVSLCLLAALAVLATAGALAALAAPRPPPGPPRPSRRPRIVLAGPSGGARSGCGMMGMGKGGATLCAKSSFST